MMIARVLGAIVHMFSPLIALVTLLLGYLETLFQWRRLPLNQKIIKIEENALFFKLSFSFFLVAKIAFKLF